VVTDAGEFSAAKLIVTAGPWAPRLLAGLGLPLVVRRKHLYWFQNADARYHEQSGCPTYLYELPQGIFYGFPQIDERGVKAAEHSGGAIVNDPATDPRERDAADLARVAEFLASYLPGVSHTLRERTVCFYTMSPDEHFLLDHTAESEHVWFAAGLSGHGFKFTSVLGQALAELATNARTDLPITFLSADRFRAT
jgi:glycine/D-amino acid oxidase-like deaminating enzyme